MSCVRLFLSVLFILLVASTAQAAPAAGDIRLATFTVDITPPIGHPLCGGWIKPVMGNDDPEIAKGIILKQGDATCVVVVLDWCELRNGAHDLFRDRIAEAVGTTRERVAVQCVHQHNAPLTDSDAQLLLDRLDGAFMHADLDFLEETARAVAGAAKSASVWHAVTEVGTSKARVDRVASSRRLLQPDGTIVVRYSSAKEEKLRGGPEGKIDPYLRTVAFFAGDRPLAYLHYYATHPMSYYGDGMTTWDFVGIARERVQKETGVFQLYFTGCGGDITAGKYNDGTPPRRQELAGRMADAMKASIQAVERGPVGSVEWRVHPIQFPLRSEPEFAKPYHEERMGKPEASAVERFNSAINLAWINRVERGQPIDLTCLVVGAAHIIHLPGEPMVEYQLHAQRSGGVKFVAVAGYADGGPGYVVTAEAYTQGGYEPTASLVAPESEQLLKAAIDELLAGGETQ